MTEQVEAVDQESTEETEEVQVTEEQFNRLQRKWRDEQNLPLAIVAGVVAAIVGAAIWAVVTAVTGYQIGWMAIAVGFLVGYAVRFAGKGIDLIYGIIGALFALAGCVLGNLFTMIYFVSAEAQISFFQLLMNVEFKLLVGAMKEGFQFMDILFYSLAVYEGYKFSFRQATEEELSGPAL